MNLFDASVIVLGGTRVMGGGYSRGAARSLKPKEIRDP